MLMQAEKIRELCKKLENNMERMDSNCDFRFLYEECNELIHELKILNNLLDRANELVQEQTGATEVVKTMTLFKMKKQVLNSLVDKANGLTQNKKDTTKQESIPAIATEVTIALATLKKLLIGFKKLDEIKKEIAAIEAGDYQTQLSSFTYGLVDFTFIKHPIPKETHLQSHHVYSLMNQPGLRCTVAIPNVTINPVEIQVNFLGTIDFASKIVDLEDGGPGQETLKKNERKLVEKITKILDQFLIAYPDTTFKLRIAGHSLGGALAKGFSHMLQRAIAVQENIPENIVNEIKNNLPATYLKSDPALIDLQNTLTRDKAQFNDKISLKQIQSVSVYALGAPGISSKTDESATLMTYYGEDTSFLRVYNHHHKADIMTGFGESEFLSGKKLEPRILIHKDIEYSFSISEQEAKSYTALPFPGVTQEVMAAHCIHIASRKDAHSETSDINKSSALLLKFEFSSLRIALYKFIALIAQALARIEKLQEMFPDLISMESCELDIPVLQFPLC